MASSGAVMIEGENYEVVDECVEEEESNPVPNKSDENVDVPADKAEESDPSVPNKPDKNADVPADNPEESDPSVPNKPDENADAPTDKAEESNPSVSNKPAENTDVPADIPEESNPSEPNKPDKIVEAPADKAEESNPSAPLSPGEPADAPANKAEESSVKDSANESSKMEGIEVGSIEKETEQTQVNEQLNQAQKEGEVEQQEQGNQDIQNKQDDSVNATKTNVTVTETSFNDNVKSSANKDIIDFTADISLDHLDEQKNLTDEDVMHHLDEIESIILAEANFDLHLGDKTDNLSSHCHIKPEQQANEENAIREVHLPVKTKQFNSKKLIKKEMHMQNLEMSPWYKKKLAAKEAIIKERLSKLARVLGCSYPSYDKWLKWVEKTKGSPVCKVERSRHCCLDKPHCNRWKFMCNRKSVEESAKEMGDADSSNNKNVESVWRLEATGHWNVNTNNQSEFPPFVLRAVKVFEDFLQTTEQPGPQEAETSTENFFDDFSLDMNGKKKDNDQRQTWMWLLVRCNSMDELMLFATGRNISRSTMDRLKQVYETGPGKDCNVKSLYCKSMNKANDAMGSNTTFLVGSEALDETVGGIKVQLAPKTNFWSNALGAENVANTVQDLLMPNQKTTILEIGCGIGLIGLMMAPKCQQVIGVDSPSEVEEAEMTCELNNIRNASFIMGSPPEITSKIVAAVKNRKTSAVINANTNIGRAIEVMTCLRKIPSLKKIAMVTTLTKQSVRAILELARPVDCNHPLPPFLPIIARVVDTLPAGPHFEAVILMERRMAHKFNHKWYLGPVNDKPNIVENEKPQTGYIKLEPNTSIPVSDTSTPNAETKKNFKKLVAQKAKPPQLKKNTLVKNIVNISQRGKFRGKRARSPDKPEGPPKKIMKNLEKFGVKPWKLDFQGKKPEWFEETPQLRVNPMFEKSMREHKEQADLRERLSSNRDTDIAQKVKENQVLLNIAKERLSGPTNAVDVATAKQLQMMLNMVLEQTNKLHNQLPRSVWDRIAPPPDNVNNMSQIKNEPEDHPLKGRYVQETGFQDIVITTPNTKYESDIDQKPTFRKNLPPLEPNMVMPVGITSITKRQNSMRRLPERYHALDMQRQQPKEDSWNREKIMEKHRWPETETTRRHASPVKRQLSPMRHRESPPRRFSPKRPLLSPPRRPYSPPRRHYSPPRRQPSPFRPRNSPPRRQMSPQKAPISPPRRPASPMGRPFAMGRRPMSPPGRAMSPLNRPMSPLNRPMSPSNRPMSPMRGFELPMRPSRMISPSRRNLFPPRRQEMPQERQHISPVRREPSPHRMQIERPMSPPRRQMSPQRYTDDWDIPNRRTIEESNWVRSVDKTPDNMWQMDKQSTSTPNWEQLADNDKYRKLFNQENWNMKEMSRDDSWNNGGSSWSSKQQAQKAMAKKTWPQNSDNRWASTSTFTNSNENWNIRGKETFNSRDEPWTDSNKQSRWESSHTKESWNQNEKEDWNDLPEDARDPWGDDNSIGLKERWLKEKAAASSSWTRDADKFDPWLKTKKNWQSKMQALNAKPQWQNSGNNSGESRWNFQSDGGKEAPSTSWQSGSSLRSWQPNLFSSGSFK